MLPRLYLPAPEGERSGPTAPRYSFIFCRPRNEITSVEVKYHPEASAVSASAAVSHGGASLNVGGLAGPSTCRRHALVTVEVIVKVVDETVCRRSFQPLCSSVQGVVHFIKYVRYNRPRAR